MEMKLDMARQNCTALFWLKPCTKAAAGVVMTVDHNNTLLTVVSGWFIIIEVYSMRKISVNL